MHLKESRLAICAILAILSGCGQSKAPLSATAVDSQPIRQDFLDYFVFKETGVGADQVPQDRKDQLRLNLRKMIAAGQVEMSKMTPEVQHELELQRIKILAHAAAVAAGVFAVPTGTELSAAYDQFKAALPAREYHVEHILVATENMASSEIVRLQAGAEFAKRAKEISADDSKTRGGDIGWISPGKLPAAFTDAVAALRVGEFTKKPVHTIYGWHVIRLIETRPGIAPSFDQVEAQLAANIQQERYRKFLDDSLKNVGAVR
jgi:peptidyl-prolyl cis-trans isomerase C